MTAWDAARAASKRPLRKSYKACAPVGERLCSDTGDLFERVIFNEGEVSACEDCGYHVCSCERLQRRKFNFPINPDMEHGEPCFNAPAFTLRPPIFFNTPVGPLKVVTSPNIPPGAFFLDLQSRHGHELKLPADPKAKEAVITLLTTGQLPKDKP